MTDLDIGARRRIKQRVRLRGTPSHGDIPFGCLRVGPGRMVAWESCGVARQVPERAEPIEATASRAAAPPASVASRSTHWVHEAPDGAS